MKKQKEQKQKKPPTEVMSVRMTKPECDLIRDIAHEYDLTASQIIRLVLNSNMKKYVRRVYTDPEQGEMILTAIRDASEDMSDIKTNLHRIGVNFNQDIKLRQMQKQYDELTKKIQWVSDPTVLEDMFARRGMLEASLTQLKAARSGNQADINLVTQWMKMFDDASKRMSDALWHIR